jgi:hypothetical protein
MRIRFLAVAALLMSALAVAPANAATDKRDDVWVGQIVRHRSERLTPPMSGGHPPSPGHHFDYRGSACPTSAEMCIKVLANYRVVPLNSKAATGLRRAAGGRAKLVGYRAPAPNSRHNAILYVRQVEKA